MNPSGTKVFDRVGDESARRVIRAVRVGGRKDCDPESSGLLGPGTPRLAAVERTLLLCHGLSIGSTCVVLRKVAPSGD
jgi:hypothetical protein